MHAEKAVITMRGNLSLYHRLSRGGQYCDYCSPRVGIYIYNQIEITLKMMGFWQRVLKGEKYVTDSFVPLAIYTIRQSFLQVFASQATKQVLKELTRILLNDLDWRFHPTTNGKLKYERETLIGHGNRYISIHPYFKGSFS